MRQYTWLIIAFRYAYFHNLPHEDLPYIKIPLHTVIKLTPKAYGCDEERCVMYLRLQTALTHFTIDIPCQSAQSIPTARSLELHSPRSLHQATESTTSMDWIPTMPSLVAHFWNLFSHLEVHTARNIIWYTITRYNCGQHSVGYGVRQ